MSSSDMAGHVFETLWRGGRRRSGLKLCGMHMMDSGRIEKAFRHFGHDITCEDHVLEAGLGFAVKTDKPDFIGRDAVLRKKEAGLEQAAGAVPPDRSRTAAVSQRTDPAGRRDCGLSRRRATYGHHAGRRDRLGYVPCKGESAAEVLASSYQIEVAGVRVAAEASLKPMYDPKSERVKV